MLQSIGRIFFSLAIVGIGIETLLCAAGHKVVPVIPWMPAIPILVYPAGIIFVLCGAGLFFQNSRAVSAIILGVLMILAGLAFDVPRQFDIMSAPWRTNALEPIVIGCLAWLGFACIPGWLHRTSRYLIAFALIVFGIGHFQILTMIAGMVPGWIPWHRFWTVFFGVAFVAAGVSLATGFLQTWAVLASGLMFAVWTLTIHLPALIAKPVPDNCSDVFIVVALWGGFWAIVGNTKDSNAEANLKGN